MPRYAKANQTIDDLKNKIIATLKSTSGDDADDVGYAVYHVLYGYSTQKIKDDLSKIEVDGENAELIGEFNMPGTEDLEQFEMLNGVPIAWCAIGCETCHSSQRLFDWNWAKNYPTSIPHGYVLKAFRLNSKHCPYAVDFNYRLNLTKNNYVKWMYRNPKCKLDGFFQPEDWKEWIQDARVEYKGKLDKLKHQVDMDKVSKRDRKAMSQKAR